MAEPHDQEAEDFTLGAVFLGGGRALDALVNDVRLAPTHFYRKSMGAIYQAMLDVHANGDQIDPAAVRIQLERRFGKLDGSNTQLELLAGSVPAIGNYRLYAQRVIEKAVWRERRRELHERMEAIEREDESAYNAVATAQGVELAGHDGLLTTESLAERWMEWYEADVGDAILTPWPKINEGLFGGLRPGDVTAMPGHPGMGKSAAGDQLVDYAIETNPIVRERGGCIYINEMRDVDRISRLLASKADVSFKRIMRRELSGPELARVVRAAPHLPFAVQPCAGWSADAIASHIRRHKWGIAFVDHATRIPAQTTAEWDHVSHVLADAARQANTHLILALQLNRERNTSAARPMPVLRDLRNTGAWEQDARNVLFVHRREEVDPDTGLPVTYDDGVIHLAKVNNGQPTAEAVFLKYATMQFKPASGREDDPRTKESDPYADF